MTTKVPPVRVVLFIVLFSVTSFMSHKVPKSNARNINENILLSSTANISRNRYNITTQVTKRHIDKLSRKQYEIINMLWRKTKIFIDVETNTSKYRSRKHNTTGFPIFTDELLRQKYLHVPRMLPEFETSTPSYIEFYYMHEIDDSSNERGYSNSNHAIDVKTKEDKIRRTTLGTVKVFYLFDRLYRTPKQTSFKSFPTCGRTRSNIKISSHLNGTLSKLNTNSFLERSKPKSWSTKPSDSDSTKQFDIKNNKSKLNATALHKCSNKTDIFNNVTETTTNLNELQNLTLNDTMSDDISVLSDTTVNDKVKFFEIYDYHPPLRLENVDFDIVDSNLDKKSKHRKKHIIKTKRNVTQSNETSTFEKSITRGLRNNSKKKNNVQLSTTSKFSTTSKMEYNYRLVSWLNYPFVAVYNYDPLQVRCDAAGISPHWLIASASCLSRHHTNPGGYGQSAFVAYCGDRWWQPERIAYVKYSLIHPKFRPWDKTRRRLYNIGLIRVISSMTSSCSDWAPISLMSHQFHSNQNGSKALAIGWGLDRFDSKYSFTNLPKRTPSVYESVLYSNDCPGNMEYSKLKNNYRDTSIANIYCLSLPQYFGEENDPQHGSLLLVGGKLIGLYLQEERRGRGEQSAQYTGTWRLVPWVLDVAREPDEADAFTVDI